MRTTTPTHRQANDKPLSYVPKDEASTRSMREKMRAAEALQQAEAELVTEIYRVERERNHQLLVSKFNGTMVVGKPSPSRT